MARAIVFGVTKGDAIERQGCWPVRFSPKIKECHEVASKSGALAERDGEGGVRKREPSSSRLLVVVVVVINSRRFVCFKKTFLSYEVHVFSFVKSLICVRQNVETELRKKVFRIDYTGSDVISITLDSFEE